MVFSYAVTAPNQKKASIGKILVFIDQETADEKLNSNESSFYECPRKQIPKSKQY